MGLKEKLSGQVRLLAMLVCLGFLGSAIFSLINRAFLPAAASAAMALAMALAWGFKPWKWRPRDVFVSEERNRGQGAGKPQSLVFPLLLCLVFLVLGIFKRGLILLGLSLVFGCVYYLRKRAKVQRQQ